MSLAIMADTLPYQAEYAKSGRAGCKGCKDKIDQGTLRIAAMVQSAFYDGKQPNWYHWKCFFDKQRPKSVDEIGKYNTLRNPDKVQIKELIEAYGSGIVMPVETKGKGKGSKKRAAASTTSGAALKDFAVEYSKSSRATCRVCDLKICKDEVRICKIVFDTEVGQKYGGQPLWHHVKCFAEERENLLYFAGGEDLNGFKSLSKEDKALVKSSVKPLKNNEVPVKKLKEEPLDDKLEKKMNAQNTKFHKVKDALEQLSKSDWQQLLEENAQEIPSGKDKMLEHLADCIVFGALYPCEKCQGQLVLDTYGYKCTGNQTEWTACTNITASPKRVPFKVPKQYAHLSIFKSKPKVVKREFKPAPAAPVIIKTEASLSQNNIKKEKPIPPLKNLKFFLYGKLVTPKEDLKNKILKLGGIVTRTIMNDVAAVISTKKDVERMPDKMEEIKETDIEVVEESFLDLIDKDKGTIQKSLELIKEHNIAEWGSDPVKRLPTDVLDGKSTNKSSSIYTKSTKSGPTKLKLKGGTAVDPDSGLADEAHVYKDEYGTKWTVTLGYTDIVTQKNSFYKMQLLKADSKKKYWLFRSWGRIGTTIGGNKVDSCSSLDEAKSKFEDQYLDKTGNYWEFRDKFVKNGGKYAPIDVDYDDDTDSAVKLTEDSSCKLPAPVQTLIMKIFDVEVMKKTLLEFELDTEKMPLGKLSKKQIKAGYKVLTELLNYIENEQKSDKKDVHKIIDATNRFYTLIPHNFGVENPPPLNDVAMIKAKSELLDNMLEIEIAYSLMKTESSDSEISPIESHYKKLKAEIVPLENGTPEYDMLIQYVKNTHAKTHSQYSLDVEQIFKVVREGEDKRYKPFRKLHNRHLLWHGSRITNFAGILSQGLRIAPPEAPMTGYMFGKGIYFADMVSKSANYCCTNRSSPTGVMLLCEVALGNMKECANAEYVTSLPSGVNSVKGVGRTQPDPAQNVVLDDGLIVPCGTPIQNPIQSSLLYNEFIVYDVAQVNVKYLFQMKFKFNM